MFAQKPLLIGTVLALLTVSCDDDKESDELPAFQVTVEDITFSTANISWTPVEDALFYDVYLEGNLVEDSHSGTHFVLTGLVGDIEYTGKVIAITLRGRVIAPFSFTTSINFTHGKKYYPTEAIVRYRQWSGFYQYDYVDSTWYKFTYAGDNVIKRIEKTVKRFSCTDYEECGVLDFQRRERVEFEYKSRRLEIYCHDENDVPLSKAVFGFNNESYVLPEYASFTTFSEPKRDSLLFEYFSNHLLKSYEWYENNVRMHVQTFRQKDRNLYINDPYGSDSLGVVYTADTLATIHQFTGVPVFNHLEGTLRIRPDAAGFALTMFKSSEDLAKRLTWIGPGWDGYKYTLSGDTVKTIDYWFSDVSQRLWKIELKY